MINNDDEIKETIENKAKKNSNAAIELAKKIKKELDYSPNSIKDLEELLELCSNSILKKQLPENKIFNLALIFGSYLGEVMLKNGLLQKGYKWGKDATSELPLLICNDGAYITPIDKVYKRLVHGKQDNVISFYNFVMRTINKFDVTIYRKFHLCGILVPFYVVINYEIEDFKNLINKYNSKEITKEELTSKLSEIKIFKISNKQKKKFEFSTNNTKVFITNMNVENTKVNPLICSNQLIINNNAELIFEINKYVNELKFSLTNISKNEKNKMKVNDSGLEVTRSDINIWTTNDQLYSLYKFGIPGEELDGRKKQYVMNLGIETCNEGNKSNICPNVHFKNYDGFDMVVLTDGNNKINNLWPIILRQSNLGVQYLYDLLIKYDDEHKEYNLLKVNENIDVSEENFASSRINGDIRTLELFLNYGLGAMKTQETYQLLMNSKEYNINGFGIVRDGEKVFVDIKDNILKSCANLEKCEILNEAFKRLIELWYDKE